MRFPNKEEADSLFQGSVVFLFFFQPKKQDKKELQFLFRQNGFEYPVFIDTKNEMNKINKFPTDNQYQCFLLGKDNKVVLIGNPSANAGIWQLFKKYISERDSINQGKKEESLAFYNQTTLSPAFPQIRKEATKVTN